MVKFIKVLFIIINGMFISLLIGCGNTKEYLCGTYTIVSIDQEYEDAKLINFSRSHLIDNDPSYITFGKLKEIHGQNVIWHNINQEDEVIAFYNCIAPSKEMQKYWLINDYSSRSYYTSKYYAKDNVIHLNEEVEFGDCKIEIILNDDIIKILYYTKYKDELILIFNARYQKTSDEFYPRAAYDESIKDEW